MKRVVVNIPDSVDLSKVNDVKLCIRYYKDNDEYSYVTDGFSIQEERPQGEWISKEEALKIMCEKCPVYNCVSKCNGYRSIENMSSVQLQRPQGECKTCRHRDPEDKKCECGEIERLGWAFPVSDNYFCKFYEKGGAEC